MSPRPRILIRTTVAQSELAGYIDHTCLEPDASSRDIARLCDEARQYGFHGVCINSSWVALCSSLLGSSESVVVAAVAFPQGTSSHQSKVAEARQAIKDGARELDAVINIGRFLDGDSEYVSTEMTELASLAHSDGVLLKAIIETGYLRSSEIDKASRLVKEAGADFVKTSTGFGPRGVTVEDIRVIRRSVGPNFGIKAAGGIRTFDQAIALIDAGATRLGCSNSLSLVRSK